ncbi:carotenoid oxygenase family protein [Geobacter sp. SVR]|uniref:carotenoid oxygenase family protein n=1 Tax=Geobacter sp. SVR TaxID=2495594 RepID=UPI00143EF563|nr:carotenoid oxygenase family protein [Geobacter sp. SVR]BCS52949.1 dioxygenase [Geobacter sp. SVR]GCF84333.1 dioxygenase [Geobacter sp. SVR]
MLSRRRFLMLSGQASLSLAVLGCATSPPLRKEAFADFGDPARPYLGLATSLRNEYSYEARIEGQIPAQLRGTLYRNGPGLFDRGEMRKRNLLDGDGLVQSFRFHDNGVHYRNRFVRTQKFIDEERAGRFVYPSWSTQAPGGMLANFMAPGRLKSQAGITVFYWRKRLYAFDECALPYELDPDTLETSGLSLLGLPEDMTIYAAHAKMDPFSGEWLHFGVRYGPSPKIHITIFKPDGSLKQHRSVPLPRNVYMHDWFVSARHLILNLHPAEISYLGFMLGYSSMADSLRWQPEKGNLVMVFDREGDKPPLFLETPARYMWHSFNAYERGAEIIAEFIGYHNPDHFIGADPVVSAVMMGRRGEYAWPGEVRRYLIDPSARTIRDEKIASGSYEWPRINELLRGRCCRFGYMAKTARGEFFWSLICRIDLHTGRMENFDFGAGCYCSEPVFVPIPRVAYSAEDSREAGFLLTEVYDSGTKKSFLAVLRADCLSAGPIARVHLSHHVPFSYHGWWHAQRA